jgi:prolyl oligopeptidase
LDIIPGADNADLAWSPDSPVFYYTRLPVDPSIPRADRAAYATIRYHVLGTDPRKDPEVYPKTGDASLYLTPRVSRDGRWLFVIIARGWTSNDIYVRGRQSPPRPFQPLFISTSATAEVIAWKGKFYLTTNQDAPNYKILQVDADHPQPELWKTIVPERKDTVIESAHVLGDHLVLRVLKNVSSQIEVYSLDGALLHQVELPDVGTVRDVSGHEANDDAYFEFESFFIPPRIYRFSVASGKSSLWAQTNVPINPSPYKVELVRFHSKDGTPVSMFIVRRKNIPRDGSTPFQIQGYGGFQTAMVPQFSAAIYPWLEAGGGVAIPHLRGGGEYGEAWHRAGMLTKKQNTFDDMIGAAEYLIQNGYTRESLLTMQGASNGGLLVGAVLTQRPDLFRAVVCKNPLLDMVRYPLYGVGKAWIPEYGSPDREEEFHALQAYSPYHQVKLGTRYPSVLFLSAENDDRVDPMHARKMTAALQAATASGSPILFRQLANSGHAGADRVKAQVEEATDRLSFLLEEVGQSHFSFSAGLQWTWPGVGN